MIVEQRIYSFAPGVLPGFLAAYEAFGLPVHQRIFGRPLGFYTAESGLLNQLVQLWAFDSHDDRSERRTRLLEDADWQVYRGKVKGMVLQQENRFLAPAAWPQAR
nr:NIPSNAP family protein [uncultured Roseateles sp.]